MLPPPPSDRDELRRRALSLAGRSMAQLASDLAMPVPPDLRRHKGWVGHVIERALGVTPNARAGPDFPRLGVELKTLPVDPAGRPLESTYICKAALDGSMAVEWKDSAARKKLDCVLWIPIVGAKGTPPGDRLVGSALLWQPTPEEEDLLRRDWEELAELISLADPTRLTAESGRALHLRPKAASSRDSTETTDEFGDPVRVNPKGFYLRSTFTRGILERFYRI